MAAALTAPAHADGGGDPAAVLSEQQIGVIRTLGVDDDTPIDCDTLIALVAAGCLAGPDHQRDAIAAGLAACWDRRTVALLFDRMSRPDLEPPERRAIENALVDALALGSPPPDWGAWWDRWKDVSQEAWDAGIIGRLRAQTRVLGAQRDESEAQLLEAHRRVLSLTPEGERGPAIAAMVASPSERIARIGLDLALQTLLNAGDISGGVVDAATTHLEGGSPRLVFSAARLLEQLAPDVVATRADDLLARADDAELASVVLRAVARSPDAQLEPMAIVRWIERGAIALKRGEKGLFNAACQAAARRITDDHPTARAQMLGVLDGIDDAAMTEAGASLLAILGERDRVLALLSDGPDGAALGAARALVDDEAALPLIVAQARRRPLLRPTALDAIRTSRPDKQGFALVVALAPTTDLTPAQADAIASFAAILRIDELGAAVAQVESPEVVAAALSRLVDTVGAAGPPDPRVGQLLLTLAEAQLRLNRPGPALEAAGRAWVQGEGPTARRARILTTAALQAGDVEAAEAASGQGGVPARVWLDGMRSLTGDARTRAIASIRRLYRDQLSEAEASELGALEAEAAASSDPPPAGDPPAEPGP